jgi:NitT/TauT family transport system permease protein
MVPDVRSASLSETGSARLKDAPVPIPDHADEADVAVPVRSRWRRIWASAHRPLISFVAFIALWEIATRVMNQPLFLTGPVDTIQAGVAMYHTGILQSDFLVSAREFGIGFGFALVVGILLGMVLGTSNAIKAYADPLLNAFYATPLIALAPLFILWFGIGDTKTIVLVFLLAFLPIAINTDVGIRATEVHLLEAASSFGANRLQLFTMVRLPTSIPFVVAGIRMGIARGLIGVVVGELFGSQAGLGYRMLVSAQFFATGALICGIVIFAVSGMTLVFLMEWIEHRAAPWRTEGLR